MGVFERILGCFASCCGLSSQPRKRYSNYDIPKVVKQSVHHSYQARSSHSSGRQRFSSGAETRSFTGLDPTARQPTQPRVAQNDAFNYDKECLVSSNTYNSTSIRTRQTTSGSEFATNTPALLVNRRGKSKNTGRRRSEVTQRATPHHVKQQQARQVKLPQTQPVKLSQAESVRPTPVKYYLRNFTCQLKTTSKDKTFIPKDDVIYQNQWTACSAMILDQFGNQLSNSMHTVKLSSNSCAEFCDSKTKAGRLQFNMKSSETGNISISIQIDKFTLIKDFYVTCSPCSSTLSEMVVKKMDSLEDECLYRLAVVDVFGQQILSDSPVICKLETASPGENKVVEKRMYSEDGKKYFDINVRGQRPWSKELVVFLNGKSVLPVTKIEVSHEERDKITPLLEKNRNVLLEKDQVPIDYFVHCLGSRMFIPFLTGDDDGEFVPYNENNCQIQRLPGRNGYQLVCQHAKKYDILGADFAHINNIKRVLQLKDRVEIKESPDQTNVIIDLNNVQSHLYPICKEVVKHLLRGLYYRWKASEAAKVRMEWKKRFISLHKVLLLSLKDSPILKLCKVFKDCYGGLMNKHNREACDELFKFFNFQRDESEIDLHGLLVADEERLESQRLDMLRESLSDEEINTLFGQCKMKSFKGRKKQALKKELLKGEMSDDEIEDFIELCRDYIHDESRLKAFKRDLLGRRKDSKRVDGIIEKWRSESDEAIRKLNVTLDSFDLEGAIKNNTPWLEIIVGAGHHSRIKNEQTIRPKVEKLLQERNLEFAAVNKGSLVVTYQAYSGPEPCFGEYYCKKCDHRWQSSKSYVGKYQKCARCHEVNCWPVKQREKNKVVNYRRDGAWPVKRQSGPHQSSLCQKCRELGYPCNENDYYDPD